ADNYMKVQFSADEDLIGQLVKVKITKADYPINEGQVLRVISHASNQTEHTIVT
ncbi:tRNA (N(6)-L-threonylcarbamoyladenosine(37)-C(2))-methylthiotransferase MtaB, partial [Staphylococcus arlettae]